MSSQKNQLHDANVIIVLKLVILIVITLIPEILVAQSNYNNVLRMGTLAIGNWIIDKADLTSLSIIAFSGLLGGFFYKPVRAYLQSHEKGDSLLGLSWKHWFSLCVLLILILTILSGYIGSEYNRINYLVSNGRVANLNAGVRYAAITLFTILSLTLVIISGLFQALATNYIAILRIRRRIYKLRNKNNDNHEGRKLLEERMVESRKIRDSIVKYLELEKNLLTMKKIPMSLIEILKKIKL